MRTRNRRAGFTLVEILTVIAIILLVSVIAIPVIYTSINGRQVSDGARIFTGALQGVRDAAVKANEPRGLRLLPDPLLTVPAPGLSGAGTTQLVWNRMVPIEPAGDYSEGRVNVGPQLPSGVSQAGFPPAYPRDVLGSIYPFYNTGSGFTTQVLMVEESPFNGGFTSFTPGFQNSPTNWYWNIRVGDKIKLNGTGRAYTVVGPLTVNPWGDPTKGTLGNYELFVNVGPPGTPPPLTRSYYATGTGSTPPPFTPAAIYNPEFLFLVNGQDDDKDGFVDEGWNGFDEPQPNPSPPPPQIPPNGFTDELLEWETEQWTGTIADSLNDTGSSSGETPTTLWLQNNWQTGVHDVAYTIQRRPVVTAGAREIALPAGIVIEATTWNTTRERSRATVTPGSLYCDIMVNPNGQYIPTTTYSSPTSGGDESHLHFWLAETGDVHPRGAVWGTGTGGAPNPNPANTPTLTLYELPMTKEAMGPSGGTIVSGPGFYPPASQPLAPILKGDRRLVTMFKRSGTIVTNTIESVPPASAFQPGEGFYINDPNYPFYQAQLGRRETK